MLPTLTIDEFWLVMVRVTDDLGVRDEAQFWRAPAGRMGQKRIVRASHAGATVLGAAPLASFSKLRPVAPASLKESIITWLQGHERVVFVTGEGEGPPQVIITRGKTCKQAQDDATEMGHGAITSLSLAEALPRISLMRSILAKQDFTSLAQDIIRNPPTHAGNGHLLPSELAEYNRATTSSDWSKS